MTDVIQKKEKMVIMMVNMIIPPLQSPHQDGSNGGLIIKIGFFININWINSENRVRVDYIYIMT
jgi:hypothetical protein